MRNKIKHYFIILGIICLVYGLMSNSAVAAGPLPEEISVAQAEKLWSAGQFALILDVRTQAEYESPLGHLPQSLLMPIQELPSRVAELIPYKGQLIGVICHAGARSSKAAGILRTLGYQAVNIDGGVAAWAEAGYAIEKGRWVYPSARTASASPANANAIYFVVSGERQGEVEPCGCSPEASMGGFKRFGSFFAQIQRQSQAVLYLDLGNNFPANDVPPKIELIQTVLTRLKPAAILIGPNELIHGLPTLDPKLPYLISNALTPQFSAYQHVVYPGREFLILGYLSPKYAYHEKHANSPAWLRSIDQTLLNTWKHQRSKFVAAEAILLFRGDADELRAMHSAGLFDRIFTGNTGFDDENQMLFMQVGERKYPTVPLRGMGVLHGQWHEPGKAESFKTEWLDNRYADDPQMLPLIEHYNETLKQTALKNAELEKKHLQESPYAGGHTCASCHEAAVNIWKKSKHAKAYTRLQEVGKVYDPECLICHTVGFKQNGFISKRITPKLADVQCENCHGPSRKHVENPKESRLLPLPSEQFCLSCHQPSHSPNFQFKTYWPQLVHPEQRK